VPAEFDTNRIDDYEPPTFHELSKRSRRIIIDVSSDSDSDNNDKLMGSKIPDRVKSKNVALTSICKNMKRQQM
jgi:hypothetical protein